MAANQSGRGNGRTNPNARREPPEATVAELKSKVEATPPAEKEKTEVPQMEPAPTEVPTAPEVQPTPETEPAPDSTSEPVPAQTVIDPHPGGVVYVEGSGWLECQALGEVTYAEDMYENGNKIGSMS